MEYSSPPTWLIEGSTTPNSLLIASNANSYHQGIDVPNYARASEPLNEVPATIKKAADLKITS